MKISAQSQTVFKMSTSKRLAKRSIVGTRVCAPGPDKLYYSGIIQKVKTPSIGIIDTNHCITLTHDTKYTVRFDVGQAMVGTREYLGSELIGPGFQNVINVNLATGQRVFITYNGRESVAGVMSHDFAKDEILVRIPANGFEPPIEVKKRLEEVRLLESRRSPRLVDSDTDFAKLADMANDRRRASHTIDVPLALTQYGSRKRRPSYTQENELYMGGFRDDEQMDECNAALVLMSLSGSPHSPRQWMLSSSPASNSSASWISSGSDELSDENGVANTHHHTTWNNQNSSNNRLRTASLSTSDEGIVMDYRDDTPRKRRVNTTLFKCTWKKCNVIHRTVYEIEDHVREAHLGLQKSRVVDEHFDDDDDDDDGEYDNLSDTVPDEAFYYTEIEAEIETDIEQTTKSPNPPSPPTLSHRDMARPPHEDPEYQRQLVGNMRQGLLTMSQSGNVSQSVKPPLPVVAGAINIPNSSPLAHHNYTWAQQSSMSPQKHVRLSPRPSTSYAPYPSPTYTSAIAAAQHNVNVALGLQNSYGGASATTSGGGSIRTTGSIAILNGNSNIHHTSHHLQQDVLNLSHSAPSTSGTTSVIQRSPLSPNRRPRGENKKCRKQYGMEKKELWCTQCKWKKACSRFGD